MGTLAASLGGRVIAANCVSGTVFVARSAARGGIPSQQPVRVRQNRGASRCGPLACVLAMQLGPARLDPVALG